MRKDSESSRSEDGRKSPPRAIPADYFDRYPRQAPEAYRKLMRIKTEKPSGNLIDRTVP
jgi:hypothetical protein